MKKLFIPVVVLLVCAFIITGCNSGASSTPTAPSSSAPVTSQPAVSNVPATSTAAVKPSASATAATAPVTSPSVGTANKNGGTLKIIEAVAPGSPIGATWETPFVIPSTQVCLEPALNELIDGSIGPRLATSYDINADPKAPSITFHLRKGVKFSDGTDFNAQAVKFTWDKVKNSGYFGGTKYWVSVDVVDDYTINIPFTMNRNSSINAFAKNQCFVISPTAFDKNGIDWIRTHMVGTGPFIQTDFQRDVSLTTVKNPNYWLTGHPYPDGIQYLYVADELTRLALYKSGGADVLNANGNPRVAADFQAQGYNVLSQSTGSAVLIPDSANADSPWSNLKVRQAAEYAIDKESIAKTFGYGFWTAAYEMPPTFSPAFVPGLPGRKFDVAKAKSLLAEAGFPNGFKTKIICNPAGLNRDIVIALQSYLSKVGITVDLEFPEPAAFTAYTNGTWSGLIYTSIGVSANYNVIYGFTFPVPQAIYKSLKQPDGYADMYNATMTNATVDPKLQQKIIQAFYDSATLMPLYYSTDMFILKSNVQDSGWGTRGDSIYYNPDNIWLSK